MYHDLKELIQHSQSSRAFFLSLPVDLQCKLHEHNAYVHSAAELHARAAAIQSCERMDVLGGWSRHKP